MTALHSATNNGHTIMCKISVEAGTGSASVNAKDNDERTALRVMDDNGHNEYVYD